ncbi:hypothetical protein IFR05_007812 [Cadophora sp. M221]|nr:hypothetical protein IFR05_007812 [Cadophora sp. M221]
MSHGPMSDCPNRTQTFITARSLQEHQNQHPDKSTADNIPLQRCPNASGGGFLDLRTSALDDQISHLGSPCSKPASVNSGASTGYQEYVFDSKSAHSSFGSCASGVSATSRASGRRGPLSDWARTGMNTLKAVGVEEEPSIEETNAAEDSNDVHSLLNYLESGRYGISWLYEENDAKFKEKDEVFASRAIAARKLILEEISKAHDLAGYPLSASDLSPVKEGVLTAVWEILHCDPTCGILDNNILSDERGNFGCLARLLSSAAVCQANTKSNQLIAQSVICLRTCAQALRAKQANLLERHWHQECSPRCCRFECIATINMHLRLYMKELSRVFFNKDNMRNPHVWWLSTFYSFCIQSIIRKALIDLTSCSSTIQHWDGFSARQYLHLPIRLFIASTAALDIVNSKDGFSYVCFPKNAYVVPHKNEIFGLMLAVEQPKWEGNNITCTSMYLNRLFGFEDDGRYITFDYRSEENKVWKEIFHGRSETLPLAALQEYQNSFGHVKADSKFICGEEGCRKRYPTRLHLFRHLIQHTSGQVLDCERPHCTLDSGDRAQHWLNHNPLYTLKCRYADQTFHFSLQDVYLFNKRIWRQLWMDGKDPDPVWISDTFRAAEGGFGSYSSDDNDRRRPAKKAKKRAKTKLWGSSFQNAYPHGLDREFIHDHLSHAKASIRCFDDAPMAVRATDIVISARQRAEPPPQAFPPDQLGIDIRKPNLVELKAVYDFQNLARCLEHVYIKSRALAFQSLEITMLTGAVLYRAYNEPLHVAEKEGLPVYNFDTEAETKAGESTWREYDKIFGPLADWLVKDGKTRGVEEDRCEDNSDASDDLSDDSADSDRRPSISFDSATLGVLREIIILMTEYETLSKNLVQRGCSEHEWMLERSNHFKQDVRTVSVIMFGSFCIEEPLAFTTLGAASSIDIPLKTIYLRRHSTLLGLHDGYPAMPPMFQFFDYILRKEFNLKFKYSLFDDHPGSGYALEVKSGFVLLSKELRYFEPYHRPVLSHSE